MTISGILCIIAVALLTVTSIFLINGKALDLVPGYSELSKKEKANLDAKKFGRKMGIPMAIIDVIMILFLLITFFSNSEVLKTYAGYGMVVLIFVSLVARDFTKFTDDKKKK